MSASNEIQTAPQTQRTTLYYREGSSDKVFQASIEPQGDLFVVNFALGRRASTLSTGTKTPDLVDLETATRIFTKLVNENKAKGHTEGPEGTPYQDPAKQDCVPEPIGLPSVSTHFNHQSASSTARTRGARRFAVLAVT